MTIAALLAVALRDPEVVAALREALQIEAPADEHLDIATIEARYHVKRRAVLNAGRAGHFTILRAGRKPVVRRSELERWLARPTLKKTTAPAPVDDDPEINRAAARLSKGRAA